MSVLQELKALTKDFHKHGVNPYAYKTHVILFDSGSEDDRPFLTHSGKVEEIVALLGSHTDVKYFSVFRLGALEYQKS
jgi:hypothetical protein